MNDKITQLVEFLSETPYPTTQSLKNFCLKNAYNFDEICGLILGIATLYITDFFTKGLSNEKNLESVIQSELNMGIEVEYEHTTNKNISKKIALDHLAEFDRYYSALKAMEYLNETNPTWFKKHLKEMEKSEE